MKHIAFSAIWRWHMYPVCRELIKRGHSVQFFNSEVKPLPSDLRVFGKRPSAWFRYWLKAIVKFPYFPSEKLSMVVQFDEWVKKELHQFNTVPGLLHGWSGFSLETGKYVQSLGGSYWVERSGAHVDVEDTLIKEEIEIWGKKAGVVSASQQERDRMKAEYEQCDKILTCSSFARKTFLDAGFSEDKIFSISLGANFEKRTIVRSSQGKFVLLTIANPILEKGLFYLFEAWKRIRLKNAELQVVTTPSSLYKDYYHLPNVKFLRPMSWSKLEKIYHKASCFCLPSIQDGFGMVVSEAMSFCLPVIISSHVGAKDIVRNGIDGYIFPNRDIDRLAEIILEYYENRDLMQEHGQNAGNQVLKYSWSAYGDQLHRMIEETVSSRSL